MSNNLSLKARFFRWGFKKWSNRFRRILKFVNWFVKKLKYPKLPKLLFWKFKKQKSFINEDLYYVIRHRQSTESAFIYVHGGAFIAQINKIHWKAIRNIIKKTKATACVPIYPLSNPWYSSCEDDVNFLINIYKEMLKTFKPENITIIGDSAGASLSLIVAQQFKLLKLPKPKNIILLSPGLNLNEVIDKEKDYFRNHKEDVLNGYILAAAHRWFVKFGDDPASPIYSPMFGDSKDIGYITLFVGTAEKFYSQCKEYHDKLNEQNIKHNYFERQNMFHIYPLFPLKESREDFNTIMKLISQPNETYN